MSGSVAAVRGLGRICRAWLAGGPADADPDGDQPAAEARSDSEADVAQHHAGEARTASDDDVGHPKDGAGRTPTDSGGDTSRGQDHTGRLQGRAGGMYGGASRAARPLFIVHIDVADITRATAATIELNVRGPLPTISLKVLEQLAADADLRTVLFDGARPLAVSKKTRARMVPADTRVAVQARDQGCRFPGSRDPIGHCDVHHIVERSRGGDHQPDNLVNLSRRHHTLTHKHGWKLTLDATTGEVTATRGKRRWRSLPRATRLARAPATNAAIP